MDGNPTFGQMSFEPPMTVGKLIEALKEFDPDALVVHGRVQTGDGVFGVGLAVSPANMVVIR